MSSFSRPNSFIPDGDENYLFSRTVSVSGSELEYQFEDLQNLDENVALRKASLLSSEDQGNPVQFTEETKVNGTHDEQNAHDDEFEDSLLRRRESSPFIKTVVAERKIAQYDDFTMNSWAELQETLKSNYFVIKNGNFCSKALQSNRKLNIEGGEIIILLKNSFNLPRI
jgi:hypothetical protein